MTDVFHLRCWRDIRLAGLLAAAVLGGCAAPVRMSAPHVRSAVLVGPVACIGCAPAPLPAKRKVVFADAARSSRSIGSSQTFYVSSWEKLRPRLDQASRIVPDHCRADLQVSLLRSDAIGLGAFAVFSSWLDIEREAYPIEIERGECWETPPSGLPSPKQGVSSSVRKNPEARP